MFATLIEVVKCSGDQYWYRDHVGEQFWIDMTSSVDGWYPCIMERTKFFSVANKHIDFKIVAEADIDIIEAIRVNKVFAGNVQGSDAVK